MKYIMVTHWDDHWDGLPKGQTLYSFSMFRKGMHLDRITEDTPTIFIKLNEATKIPENCWLGYVFDIKIEEYKKKVYFRVTIEKRIPIPEKYYQYREGWYAEQLELEGDVEKTEFLNPPLINTLRNTGSWEDFENLTFFLLKLIGIHDIHKYVQQKGQADGFFKFNNLAVIYDCTLDKNFENSKSQQIKNYCAQLKDGKIVLVRSIKDVTNCQKNVWIIGRGGTRKIKEIDDITVKEVHINSIIDLYRHRLIDNLNEDEIENQLRNI